jgi:hypothetical protein
MYCTALQYFLATTFPSWIFPAVDRIDDAADLVLTSKTAAIESVMADAGVAVLMQQNKYLNNIVELDHRGVKRITQPMLTFKSFWSARIVLTGTETMHQIKKAQINYIDGSTMPSAHQFYSLAACSSVQSNRSFQLDVSHATESKFQPGATDY